MADERDSMELELELILGAWAEEEKSNAQQIESKQEKEDPEDTEIKVEKNHMHHEEISEELGIDISDVVEQPEKKAGAEREDTSKKKKTTNKKKTSNKKNTTNKKNTSKKKSGSGKSRKGFKITVTVLMGIILFIVVLAFCGMGIYLKGKNHMTSSSGMAFRIPEEVTAFSDNNGRTVSYENRDYQRRTGTTNLLLIGKNSNHTFSTIVVNFDEKSNSFHSMAVPASLLAIDYSSAMNYSDIADYVSDYLCGMPIQGYIVLDMQAVDGIVEAETNQDITDHVQMQKLTMFVEKVIDSASKDWLAPVKVTETLGESFGTNMSIADLSYVYRLYVTCSSSSEDEFTEPTDIVMVFQQCLNTFYDEKQE